MRVLSVWALLWVAGACGGGDDDGHDGGDGATADSGSGGAADASGGADGGRHDASPPDGGDPDAALADSGIADAGEPDASPGPGVVSFTFNLGPPWTQQGHRVFFLRADDSVVDIVLTDENGRAEATFDEPGTIVATLRLDAPGSSTVVFAHLGVPPGTEIRYGEGLPDRAATLTATGPAPDDPFGFGLETQCGRVFSYRTDPVASVSLAFCPPVIDVVWTAGGTIDGQEATFSAYQPSVPVDAGSIEVKGALRRDVVQSTRVTGIPETIPYADMAYRVKGPHGIVQDRESQYDLPIEGGAAVMVDPMHDLTGLGLRGFIYARWPDPLADTVVDVMATVPHDGSPNVNVSAAVPPALSDSLFDRTTGVWTWTEEGGNTPTAIQGFISLIDPDLPRNWRIVAPRQGTSVRVPRLPAPYDDLNITADSMLQGVRLNLITHSRGYAPILAGVDGLYDAGEPGDVAALEYGFDDVFQ